MFNTEKLGQIKRAHCESVYRCMDFFFFLASFLFIEKDFRRRQLIKGTKKSQGYTSGKHRQDKTKNATGFFNWLKAQNVTGRKSVLNKLKSCVSRHRKQTYVYQRGKPGRGV